MAALSRVGEIVRRHDPDRFFTALFAPPERREALLTLYAFNHELARAREVAREPMMALIRLQWWREVVEGARRQHEVATPVRAALEEGRLQPAGLLAMIEGREAELESAETLPEWREAVLATAGAVAVAAGEALAAPCCSDALRHYGAAYGVSGILRAGPSLARQGRDPLPLSHRADPASGRRAMAEIGRAFLAEARRTRLPRMALPAALPAALAGADLRRPEQAIGFRHGLARFGVVLAAARGRI